MNSTRLSRQKGSALFIMLMILVAMTILTFMATNMGKTDARISNAYAEHAKAFVNAEEMLARLRYALQQMPLPEGIAVEGATTATRPIWVTGNMYQAAQNDNNKYKYKFEDGEPDFVNPGFSYDASAGNNEGWSSSGSMTCKALENWMKETRLKIALAEEKSEDSKPSYVFDPIDCDKLDPDNKTRTIIELVSERRNKSDVDDKRNTYYYRITIQGRGDRTGQVLAQGVTGIQYN